MPKYSEEKFITLLREIQNGATVTETCRKYNISNSTYYRWKSKPTIKIPEFYISQALESENMKLMRLVVDQALDIQSLKFTINKTIQRSSYPTDL